jgi:hypothetical protein
MMICSTTTNEILCGPLKTIHDWLLANGAAEKSKVGIPVIIEFAERIGNVVPAVGVYATMTKHDRMPLLVGQVI